MFAGRGCPFDDHLFFFGLLSVAGDQFIVVTHHHAIGLRVCYRVTETQSRIEFIFRMFIWWSWGSEHFHFDEN